MTLNAFGRRMGQKFKKMHDRGGTTYQGISLRCDGFVTDSEATSKNSGLFPLLDSRVENNIENTSQSVIPSQDTPENTPQEIEF